MMKTLKLAIEGAYLLQFSRYNDERGYLEEIYNHEAFPLEIAQHFPVKQNTVSRSKKHVLRGIHISPYAKLITCVSGAIYDVVVDLRPESSTYLRWAAVELTEENCKQLFVPPLCGHAFYSLSENSTIIYCQSDCFDKSLKTERAVSLFDPVLDIFWPKPKDVTCIISKKDQTALNLDCSELHIAPKRKRILIIGASGQVGGVLFEAIGKRSEKYIAVGTYGQHAQNGLVQFDMEAAAKDVGECSVLLTMCHPAVVCVCAAFTWVDGCEKFAEKSEAVNVKAVSNICACAKEIGAKIVYFSSDYVFDGVCGQNTATCEEKLSEDSGTNPVNRYGKQKVEAEKTVLSTDSKNLVIRTSRIFGPETQGKNFVYAVVKNVLTKQRVKCLKDEISCPTYSRDLVNTTMTLIDADSSGIFHCTGPEYLSKADWGRKICRYFNLDESYVEDVSMCGEAKRPKFVAMDCSKARNILSDNFHCQSFESAMDHWKNNAFGDKSIFSVGKV